MISFFLRRLAGPVRMSAVRCLTISPVGRFPTFSQVLMRPRWTSSTSRASEEEYSVQDHLLQMEREVELYFRVLAEKASTPGIKKILERLAEDEATSYRFIENLRFSSIPYSQEEEAEIVKELRPIFLTMTIKNLDSDDRDEIRVYTKARDAKGQLRDLYLSKAEKCQDPKGKTLMELAAREADKHFQVLDETVEYLAKAEPGSGRWAECSEFFFVDNSQFQVSLERY